MKTRQTFSRRQFAQAALTGAAALFPLMAQADTPAPPPALPIDAAPQPLPGVKPPTEGDFLTRLVPINVGYALTPTQAKEVAAQLKDYPGTFAKARAYPIPDDIAPAFAASAPPRKGENQ